MPRTPRRDASRSPRSEALSGLKNAIRAINAAQTVLDKELTTREFSDLSKANVLIHDVTLSLLQSPSRDKVRRRSSKTRTRRTKSRRR